MVACLIFCAQTPPPAREAQCHRHRAGHVAGGDPDGMAFIAPLIFYMLRRERKSFLKVMRAAERVIAPVLALFWALAGVHPLVLLHGTLRRVRRRRDRAAHCPRLIWLCVFLWFWMQRLAGCNIGERP